MPVILVRHCETGANRSGRYNGHGDVPLSPGGVRRASAIAGELAGSGAVAVYSSDLRRALQTAGPIAGRLGLEVHPLADLRELHFGAWEGLTHAEVVSRWPAEAERWIADPEQVAPPEGETLGALRHRTGQALSRLQLAHPGQTIVVVTHGGPMRALLAARRGCSFWEVQVAPGSWILL